MISDVNHYAYVADTDSLAFRLELACAHRQMSQSSLARSLGVSSAAISSMKHGLRPAHNLIKGSAELLGVTEDWLRQGTPPFPEWWPRKVADSARHLVKAGLAPAAAPQPHRPTFAESAAIYAVRGMSWLVEPLYQAGESARGRILRASADPRALPLVAGSVGYDEATMAWGAWDTENPDYTFDLRTIFRTLPLGRLRLIDVLDGSGGDRYPPGCRIAVSSDLVKDTAMLNAQRGWVAWMADDDTSGVAIFNMGTDRQAELRDADGRIHRYPVNYVRVAPIYARLSESGTEPRAPKSTLVPCTSCGHGFTILRTVEDADSVAVAICPHCGSSLTPDAEAASGWRVLKSPHDQARTAAKPD